MRVLPVVTFAILLSSVFVVGVRSVAESGPITIKEDGRIDPIDAPISRNGNVYTITDDIDFGIVEGVAINIERNLPPLTFDGAGHTVHGGHRLYDVDCSFMSVWANNTTVKNLIVDGFDFGVQLHGSNVKFSNNTMVGCSGWCVEIAGSRASNCRIVGNILKGYGGVWLGEGGSNNTIVENTIECNLHSALGILNNSGNRIYHNNCVFTNGTHGYIDASPNFWDNGCEGNYWNNYNGTDLDNDGVGDTFLPWEGVDNHPLMNTYWNPCDINHDLEVNMKDIGKSAEAYGTRPESILWNPHADITGPEQLVPDGKVDMRDISLIASHYGERYA